MDAFFTPLVALHAIAASYVLTLGPINLLRRRRDRAHRVIGYGWVVAMLVTCVSSFWIRDGGSFSWLHALSVYTLFAVTMGVVAARRRRFAAHRGNMLGSYLGTAIAFLFAVLVPARRIPRLALEDPATLALVATLVAATSLGAFLALRGAGGARRPRASGGS